MAWKLAYAHDSTGSPLEGDLDDLRSAVEAGKPIRVVLDSGDTIGAYNVSTVYTYGNNVYAVNNTGIGLSISGWGFNTDAYHYFLGMSTNNGRCIHLRYKVGEHTMVGAPTDSGFNAAMKWYFQE